MESYNYNNILKFSAIIFENINEANNQEEEKDDVGFKFLLLPVNKKYPQILDIRAQAKNIETSDLKVIPIMERLVNRAKSNHNRENNNNGHANSDNFMSVKQPEAHISDTMRLKIIKMFYLEKKNRSIISEEMLLSYSSVWRILRDYESNTKEFGKMFEDNHVILRRYPAIKSNIRQFI